MILIFYRFCNINKYPHWEKAIKSDYCDKGLMMSFLFWISETYTDPENDDNKKRTIGQYWRDFKMLYTRQNKGEEIKSSISLEVAKVCTLCLNYYFTNEI